MKDYEALLKELKKNNSQVLLTHLNGREGSLKKELTRSLYSIEDKSLGEILNNNSISNLRAGKPGTQYNEGGTLTVYEPFYKRERVIIFGGGHIALPLVEFAAKVGFAVTVVDDRPSFANQVRFPQAEQVICDSFEQVFQKLKFTTNDYIVIITRGHRHDLHCLKQVLNEKETIYTGMIGSKRRVKGVLELLNEEGYDERRLKRICTPIGLSIGAITPEEISISIVAQLISRKRQGFGEEHPVSQSDVDYDVLKLLAENKDTPMSVTTVIDTKGSVPRGTGAKMVVYPTGKIIGSIGGGCSEAAVIHNAISIIGTKRYQLQTIDMTGEVAEAEGMVCGGIMEVLIEDYA